MTGPRTRFVAVHYVAELLEVTDAAVAELTPAFLAELFVPPFSISDHPQPIPSSTPWFHYRCIVSFSVFRLLTLLLDQQLFVSEFRLARFSNALLFMS